MSTYEIIGGNSDRIQFDDISYSVLMMGLTGISGHPSTGEYVTTPGQIGEIFTNIVIGKRSVSLPVSIIGDGREILEAKRLRLSKALNPMNGSCQLIWNKEDGSKVTLWCLPQSGTPSFRNGTKNSAQKWDCYIDLIAGDPCWYSSDETEAILKGYGGGFILPLILPLSFGTVGTTATISNEGDTETPCTIELRGELVNPVVTNVTTGESITINRTIEDGEILLIDTTHGKISVTHIDSSGVETNALHWVSLDSVFFQIPAGTSVIKYNAATEGTNAIAYIRFTPRWLSQ